MKGIKNMKKRIFTAILAALMLITQTVFFAKADGYELSRGIEVLLSRSQLKKCGVVNTPITFSASDFDSVLGNGEYVTFLSLPEKSAGRLMLGTTEIKKGQTLSRKAVNELVFEPAKDAKATAVFAFSDRPDSTKYGICTLFVLERENLAPKALDCPFDTVKNISYKGFLKAEDPENDDISFYVVSPPRHGTLQLLDEKSGHFMYTPKADFTGRDAFKFKVCDKYGNRSETLRVIVHIDEKTTDTVFSDMTNHWAHESAITIFDDRVLSAEISDGKLVFSPDEKITRGDFLAVAMIAAGLEDEVKRSYSTVFDDDAQIPLNIKSYANTAFSLGIIKGYPADTGVRFASSSPISRREAEIILSRIVEYLEAGKSNVRTASVTAMPTVSELGILVGMGGGEMSPGTTVTKAQLAKIYCNLKEYASSALQSR